MDKIPDHFNDAEIIQIEIGPDMARWEHILKFDQQEIDFLINLLSKQNSEQGKGLLQEMETLKTTNQKHYHTFLEFKNEQENQRECEDLDCDTHYLKQYFVLKKILLEHFHHFRDQKSKVYAYFDEASK